MTEKEKADNILDKIVEEISSSKQRTKAKLRRVHKALEDNDLEFFQWEND